MRRAARAAEHDRQHDLAARHVTQLGRVVHQLVVRAQRKVPGHEFDDRPQPDHSRADTDAGEAGLGNRRIHHAPFAEPVQQPFGHLVRPVVVADFLAHQEHALVAFHLFGHGLAQRLAVRQFSHVRPLRCGLSTLGSRDGPTTRWPVGDACRAARLFRRARAAPVRRRCRRTAWPGRARGPHPRIAPHPRLPAWPRCRWP